MNLKNIRNNFNLLTTKDIAEIMKVTPNTAGKWLKRYRIPTIKIGGANICPHRRLQKIS
ncbi:MAG: hypothetical protein DRG59_08075 [Deltaproteobacteria bacterium]|nr:MAG: hypothetical protein DRG83_18805 [Deltaproteobacteria bacterium]RLB06274.1 MAG: hypothetical protein DRG59_08075 [Deltaproteobacteria bacterium]